MILNPKLFMGGIEIREIPSGCENLLNKEGFALTETFIYVSKENFKELEKTSKTGIPPFLDRHNKEDL